MLCTLAAQGDLMVDRMNSMEREAATQKSISRKAQLEADSKSKNEKKDAEFEKAKTEAARAKGQLARLKAQLESVRYTIMCYDTRTDLTMDIDRMSLKLYRMLPKLA
jgi:chromosome segregation ATPase